ncbi:hypothetical protein GCM10008096_16470 [Zhihengliuella salsuginis]|uniref:Lipoprotein n=2 Tax=Zhihengliuella salsuginis TaxID=578222 RepID=A0ABQ3GH78_9MICC|nr:hypothetical protein GCM10008096_16470 [Zhihengliuella salsuginis]
MNTTAQNPSDAERSARAAHPAGTGRRRPRRLLPALALGALLPLALSACGSLGLTDGYDDAASKSAPTSEEGKVDGLLASWVPDGGTDVEVEQRSTGHERLMTMEYDGALPDSCAAIATVGAPTDAELEAAYSSDDRTEGLDPAEIDTEPTLTADWWPQGREDETTHLCGRWWVSQQDGTLYAFAPDTLQISDKVRAEQSEGE